MPQENCALDWARDEGVCALRARLASERKRRLEGRARLAEAVREGRRPAADWDAAEAEWQAFEASRLAQLADAEGRVRRARAAEAARRQRERVRRFVTSYVPPREVRHLPVSQMAVYLFISKLCAATGRAEIANGQIEGGTGASRATVQRATAELVRLGVLQKTERLARGGRGNLANVYRLASERLVAWARRVFGARPQSRSEAAQDIVSEADGRGLTGEAQLRTGLRPVPTQAPHSRTEESVAGNGRSKANDQTEPGGEGSARGPEDGARRPLSGEEAREAGTGPEAPSPALGAAWRPDAGELEAAHDRLARAALEEIGKPLTGSADRAAVTRAVTRLRRAHLPDFDEAEWARLRAVHGRRADLAVLEVILLGTVREGTIGPGRPASQHRKIRHPERYLFGILARRRSACRPEVTLGRLLAHRGRALPYAVRLAVAEHDEARAASRGAWTQGLGRAAA